MAYRDRNMGIGLSDILYHVYRTFEFWSDGNVFYHILQVVMSVHISVRMQYWCLEVLVIVGTLLSRM